jgi:orotate phosphoribosyltransferase
MADTASSLRYLMAAQTGHFQLASGHHGDLWLDLDRLWRRPDRVRPFAKKLATKLVPDRIDAVCGPMTGGAFLAAMVASDLRVDVAQAESRDLRGRRVALVDDAINAASAVRTTWSDLQDGGADLVALGALMVLGSPAAAFAAERGVPLRCLVTLRNQAWEPSRCPFCAAGTPLTPTAGL